MNLLIMNKPNKPGNKLKHDIVNKSFEKQFICIKSALENGTLFLNEIIYLQRRIGFADVITIRNNTQLYITLDDFDFILLCPDFVSVHPDFTVNLNHITRIDYHSIYIGKIELPIVKQYKKALLEKLNVIA